MIIRRIKGTEVPALGLGTFGLDGADAVRAVRFALDLGYRHLDTARMYGNEAEIGEAVTTSGVDRGEVFLTTKIWPTELAYGTVQRAAEESLRRLKTDYVDLLLIHWPSREIPLGETLKAFSEVKAAGQARQIGVSNFTTALLREAIHRHGADLLCNQVEYHPYLSQQPVLQALRHEGMLLTAYLPIARGAVNDEPVLVGIGKRHGKSPAQVALRWLMQQDGVAAIPRSSRQERIRENFEIFDFALDEGEMAAIDDLRGGRRIVSPAQSPDWD
jgi:2,5-diketo-D-gluconate reductase B